MARLVQRLHERQLGAIPITELGRGFGVVGFTVNDAFAPNFVGHSGFSNQVNLDPNR